MVPELSLQALDALQDVSEMSPELLSQGPLLPLQEAPVMVPELFSQDSTNVQLSGEMGGSVGNAVGSTVGRRVGAGVGMREAGESVGNKGAGPGVGAGVGEEASTPVTSCSSGTAEFWYASAKPCSASSLSYASVTMSVAVAVESSG